MDGSGAGAAPSPAKPAAAAKAAAASEAPEAAPADSSASADNAQALTLSPAVRRLVLEHGLDPSSIKGTGRDGRLTKDDVLNAAKSQGDRKSTRLNSSH